MKVLFITLEFIPAFSGNGVYSQSQVRSLCLTQQVLVLCAVPQTALQPSSSPGEHVLQVPVSKWGKLDATAPWEEFAAGSAIHSSKIADFSPDVVMLVDWSALPAWRAVQEKLPKIVPSVWLNYRVFSRTETGAGLELVSRLEAEAMAGAIASVVLSRSDKDYLTQHMVTQANRVVEPPEVLLCALRADMMQTPLPADVHDAETGADEQAACPASLQAPGFSDQASQCPSASPAGRPYLICVVRLVPEKEPHRFVELVAELQKRGVLERHKLTPLMLGAGSDEYSKRVRSDLLQAAPSSVLLDQFMGPADLSKLYSQARLNVHPATYDAFGMTIVEAASQGCPSLVHDGDGAVGATDLLRADHQEVILTDLTRDVGQVAQQVDELLSSPARLQAVRQAAAVRARSWDEEANAKALIQITEKALQQYRQTCDSACLHN